jgi:hypothetical protein
MIDSRIEPHSIFHDEVISGNPLYRHAAPNGAGHGAPTELGFHVGSLFYRHGAPLGLFIFVIAGWITDIRLLRSWNGSVGA